MRFSRTLLPLLTGLVLAFGTVQSNANPGVQLTDGIKSALAAAKPVRGDAVDREMFNGKPLLVVFFASW